MNVIAPILKFGVVSKNNRVYTRDAVADIMTDINFRESSCFCGTLAGNEDREIHQKDVAFVAENAWIRDDMLMIRARINSSPAGQAIQDMIREGNGAFSVFGRMKTGENDEITSFVLDHLVFVNEPAFDDMIPPQEVVFSKFELKDEGKEKPTKKSKSKKSSGKAQAKKSEEA